MSLVLFGACNLKYKLLTGSGTLEMSEEIKIGILTGLTAEARALGKQSDNFSVVTSAADATRGTDRLRGLINNGATLLGSVGVAGALKPGYKPGQIIVASSVMTHSTLNLTDEAHKNEANKHLKNVAYDADKIWLSKIKDIFGEDADSGLLLGVDKPISKPSEKNNLHLLTGALAVDMESHIVAKLGAESDLPWFAIRVISDPAERRIPEAALAAIGSEREVSVARVIWALLRRPVDFPALMGVAGETSIAMRYLKRVGRDFRAATK
ncbi:MAG: hypothetical protein CMM30_05515 [Rhodospirillaceae bacterium]|nr:hypothetical protein [Rhodospirillaceae bacterium]|tara:strand:- start:1084 stop:1884 length:801 start_codon:yes stop_codon:yes gene_type:complete